MNYKASIARGSIKDRKQYQSKCGKNLKITSMAREQLLGEIMYCVIIKKIYINASNNNF